MPSPARRMGTIASFLPAITGASKVASGVCTCSYIKGRLRVIS